MRVRRQGRPPIDQAVANSGTRTDIRTWALLVLALVPTGAVLIAAAFLWTSRGRQIDEFETAMVPVEITYELFSVTSPLLRAEASLRYAGDGDRPADVMARATQDRDDAVDAITRAATTLEPLLERLDPEREEVVDSQIISLLSGSVELGRDLLESQQVGAPVDPQLTLLMSLARRSAAGMVLPFASASPAEAGYVYDALTDTIEYQDRFDRDRSAILSAFESAAPVTQSLVASPVRAALWKDVTDGRLFIPATNELDWVTSAASAEAPLLLDTNDPLEALLVELGRQPDAGARDDFFIAMQALDQDLGTDVALAYSEVRSETDAHLARLRNERVLTGLTSLLMLVLGLALAGLTISEVRRRRQVEAAHNEAMVQLSEKAHRDPTTGSWNRRHLESTIELVIESAAAADEIVALAYLDLDHFKAINDVWGHSTGDQVLRTVTDRLENFEHEDVAFELCRIGGDEFVLWARMNRRPLDWFEALGRRIIDEVQADMEINDRLHEIRASLGVTTSTADSTLDSLMLEADSSLLLAKRKRGTAVVYNRDTSRTGELVGALPAALSGGEVVVHLQPIVDIETGTIPHAEALARWTRSNGEAVSPDVFIPLVESYGLAERLTSTILAAVAPVITSPHTAPEARVWVNVSPRELDVANFSERFVQGLRALDVPPSRIGLEITESAAVRDPERLAVELRRLRREGVTIAIDDFGSGYSPLGYLRLLPVDVVKIDRSLIARIEDDRANQHIVLGIVGLVAELGLEVVAEGVERIQEQEWLAAHGVRRMQGFLLGRPTRPEEFSWSYRSAPPEPVG